MRMYPKLAFHVADSKYCMHVVFLRPAKEIPAAYENTRNMVTLERLAGSSTNPIPSHERALSLSVVRGHVQFVHLPEPGVAAYDATGQSKHKSLAKSEL